MNLLFKVLLVVLVCSSLSIVGYVELSNDACGQECEGVSGSHELLIFNPQSKVARFSAETDHDLVPAANAEYLDAPNPLEQPLTNTKNQKGFGSLWSKIKKSISFSSEAPSSFDNGVNDQNQILEENGLEIAEGGIEGTGITEDDPFGLDQGGDEDGIEGTGLSSDEKVQILALGPVTQFGSIYVNGIKYETDHAELVFTNSTGASELSVGMMVEVHAQWDQEQQIISANKVVIDKQLSGPVSSVSYGEDELLLTILGASVVVNEDTVLSGVEFEGIRKGQAFEVSGVLDDRERLIATYMALRNGSNQSMVTVEVEGRVRRFKSNAMRIELMDLTVDASQAQFLDGNIEELSKNDLIEVLGVYDDRQRVLFASSIRVKDLTAIAASGSKLSIDSVITQFDSVSKFKLNGFHADASNAIITGSMALTNGVRIKANGSVNEAGVFEIRNARVVARAKYAVKAPVDMLLPSSNQVTVLGINAVTNEDTLYASNLDFPDKYQSLDSLVEGDWVQLKGNYYGGKLSLNSITTIKQQKKRSVKGLVSRIINGDVEVMGLHLEAKTSSIEKQLRQLEVGQSISAKGNLKAEGKFVVEKIGVKNRR